MLPQILSRALAMLLAIICDHSSACTASLLLSVPFHAAALCLKANGALPAPFSRLMCSGAGLDAGTELIGAAGWSTVLLLALAAMRRPRCLAGFAVAALAEAPLL